MKPYIIEQDIRFSESKLWTDQKKYYAEKGIHAWDEEVPFYITSNPFIGNRYATTIIRFMQDWVKKNPDAVSQPFYILELGAGTGQFSFYVLKALVELQKILQLDHIQFQYIMSDMTENAFDFWEKHGALKPFLKKNCVDFAVYDLYHSDKITLHRSKKIITQSNINNPMIVIANYLFDSIASDVFSVKDGKLYEARVTTSTLPNNIKNNLPINIKKINVRYKEKLIEDHYYQNDFDRVLFQYQNEFVETHFQFPIGSLQALNALRKLSNEKFLLIASDKAYGNTEEMDYCEEPELDFHGSFSVMVNFHAIGEYLKMHAGEYALQTFRENIITGVFGCGITFSELPEFQCALKQLLYSTSPTDYFSIYENLIKNYKHATLPQIAAFLNLSDWDPGLFDQLCGYIGMLTDKANSDDIAYLSDCMQKIADNFYFLPGVNDTFFDIGSYFQNVLKFETALRYYELSLRYFGDNEITYFNMAMCYHEMDQPEKSLVLMQKALSLNPKAKDTQQWVSKLEKSVRKLK